MHIIFLVEHNFRESLCDFTFFQVVNLVDQISCKNLIILNGPLSLYSTYQKHPYYAYAAVDVCVKHSVVVVMQLLEVPSLSGIQVYKLWYC